MQECISSMANAILTFRVLHSHSRHSQCCFNTFKILHEEDPSVLSEHVAAQEFLRDASCIIHNPQHRFSKTPIQPRPPVLPPPPPLLALQPQFTGDTPIPSLDYVCLVLLLCAFSRVSTCGFPRGFLGCSRGWKRLFRGNTPGRCYQVC